LWNRHWRRVSPLDPHAEYTVFRLQLPTDIQKQFHAGVVTMGNLELSSALLLTMMLEHAGLALKHKTIAAWSDNTPTMGWVWRMATKQSKIAGQFIRGLGLRQRMNETCPLAFQHIPGEKNKMADFASRSYTPSLHLHGDSHFFARFSHLFPLPQDRSWTLALPPKKITSLIFSTMRGKLQPLELCTTQLIRNIGDIGNNMQDASTSIPTCSQQPHSTISMPSKPSVLGCGKETTVKERKLTISQLIKLGAPSARPACTISGR
jgi:hypothetical protein